MQNVNHSLKKKNKEIENLVLKAKLNGYQSFLINKVRVAYIAFTFHKKDISTYTCNVYIYITQERYMHCIYHTCIQTHVWTNTLQHSNNVPNMSNP
mgnify:CR=1 FL=1